jgi:hypothetical protein
MQENSFIIGWTWDGHSGYLITKLRGYLTCVGFCDFWLFDVTPSPDWPNQWSLVVTHLEWELPITQFCADAVYTQ